MLPRGTLLAWVNTFLEKESGPEEGRLGWVKYIEKYYGVSGHAQASRPLMEYFTPAKRPFQELRVRWSREIAPERLHTYISKRRINDHTTAPEYHEDFLAPTHFGNILCEIDSGKFKVSKRCQP